MGFMRFAQLLNSKRLFTANWETQRKKERERKGGREVGRQRETTSEQQEVLLSVALSEDSFDSLALYSCVLTLSLTPSPSLSYTLSLSGTVLRQCTC